MRSAPAAGLLPLLLGLRLLLGGGAAAQYSSDLCNWKGSGLTHESHKKDVEQVYLRCSEGSIEWMYPTGALIVNLRPNTSPASYKHLTVCIKPFKDSAGANIYLEKTGELKLLVRDGDRSPSKVYCFGYDQGGLFIEATPQQDISRKITGFQYELMNKGIASDLHTVSGCLSSCACCWSSDVCSASGALGQCVETCSLVHLVFLIAMRLWSVLRKFRTDRGDLRVGSWFWGKRIERLRANVANQRRKDWSCACVLREDGNTYPQLLRQRRLMLNCSPKGALKSIPKIGGDPF